MIDVFVCAIIWNAIWLIRNQLIYCNCSAVQWVSLCMCVCLKMSSLFPVINGEMVEVSSTGIGCRCWICYLLIHFFSPQLIQLLQLIDLMNALEFDQLESNLPVNLSPFFISKKSIFLFPKTHSLFMWAAISN